MFNELDLKTLWAELDTYSTELEKESKLLEDVWLKIVELQDKNDAALTGLYSKNEFQFIPPEAIVAINVGGQIFEVPVEVLTADPYSLLASCCRLNPPLKPNDEGLYFFDRDWWLFRHIITFLKTKQLPRELETLKELYKEASYYRMNSLKLAIETIDVNELQI